VISSRGRLGRERGKEGNIWRRGQGGREEERGAGFLYP